MSAPRVAILYFSQTGNTERVARSIADGLTLSGAQADILDLLKTDPAGLARYDLVGVGTPVFYFREPVIVERFIRSIPRAKNGHAFIFLTSGGHPGNTFFHMRKSLAGRGFLVVDAFSCNGYDTYPPFKNTGRYIGHPDDAELDAARAFGAGILERSRSVAAGRAELIPVFKRRWDRFGRLALVFRSRLLALLILPRKKLLAGKCTQCGLCARHCPANAIALSPGPVFRRGCIDCYMCERVCPVEAIECDWTFIRKKMQEPEGGSSHE